MKQRPEAAMQPCVLIAIGGNSLLQAGESATIAAERAHVNQTCRAIARIVSDGWRVLITHGNGPQVGAALLRSERAAAEAYRLSLDVCVASTQGEIGFLLQQSLGAILEAIDLPRPIATVVTQVLVAADDPAFARPTKPIGPFYSRTEADRRPRLGWTMTEEPEHGYRRVVASPEPLQIITDVDRIYVDFGRQNARGLGDVTADELRRYAAAGHFPAGSMGPKVEAALRFVGAGGREAIVTSSDRLTAALQGRAGTHVFADVRAATHRSSRLPHDRIPALLCERRS